MKDNNFMDFFGKIFKIFGEKSESPKHKKSVKAFPDRKWKYITFQNIITRTLTDEERTARIARRKQSRRNRTRLICRRGYA